MAFYRFAFGRISYFIQLSKIISTSGFRMLFDKKFINSIGTVSIE